MKARSRVSDPLLFSLKSTLKFTFKYSVILAVSLSGSAGYGWGRLGHRMVAEQGAILASGSGSSDESRFWAANATNMGMLANVPDVVWKSGAGAPIERNQHWFEPDGYFDDPSQFRLFPRIYSVAVRTYSAEKVFEQGTAPWRIQQLYSLAVDAFKRGDYKTGLEMAGTMSHYVGDLSQPLHVTVNYDGQETGNKGIHSFFETANINTPTPDVLSEEVSRRAADLLVDPAFLSEFEGRIADAAFNQVIRSYSVVDAVIQTDLNLGRSSQQARGEQLALAKPRLADATATLAIILRRIWKDAGSPVFESTIDVMAPEWVAPHFIDPFEMGERNFSFSGEHGDDCGE